MSWWWWEDGATRHMGLSRIFPPRPLGPLVWPLLGRRWWCLFDVETERQLGECNFGGLQQYLRVTSAEQPHSYAPTHTLSTKATYTTPPPPLLYSVQQRTRENIAGTATHPFVAPSSATAEADSFIGNVLLNCLVAFLELCSLVCFASSYNRPNFPLPQADDK